ncbi:MAG TPA: enoyl-CoA hydratase-related protein [Thermoleophilaceae bacterium]|jgi:enoyl-CoA hydratase/carnithine racemase
MEYEQIRYEVADGILTLTMNRPERMNAWTMRMVEELLDALDRADADDDVKAIVATGEGRAFSTGADLAGGGATFDSTADAGDDYIAPDAGGRWALRAYRCHKPMIAAINGVATGVGITMTLPMDVRLASERASMGFVFARRGMTPEACSTWFLPRMVGIGQAMEWMSTGRLFSAKEAHAAGLVQAVHPPDELLDAAYSLAGKIIKHSAPVSVAITRQLAWRMLGAEHPAVAHRAETLAFEARGQSADAREGIASFVEKRPPQFTDRVSEGLPDVLPAYEEPALD